MAQRERGMVENRRQPRLQRRPEEVERRRGTRGRKNVDGRLMLTLKGDKIVPEFIKILDDYVDSHYGARMPARVATSG